MLSLFPTLLSYNLVVPFVFRLVSGLTFVVFGYRTFTERRGENAVRFERFNLKPGAVWLWALASVEMVGGMLLLAGLFTQSAALVLSLILVAGLIAKQKNPQSLELSPDILFLLFLITASLLFLGPGFYAFDLPL